MFAGCLNSNGKEAGELARSCSNLLHIVQLDVTKEDQITVAKAYVETVHRNTGCGNFSNQMARDLNDFIKIGIRLLTKC